LVNRVVPRDQLEGEVEELAAKIAKAPLITLQATKAGILRAWENMGFRTHQQASNDLQAVVTGSKEFQDYMVELMKKAAKPSDRV
jgi:enoyl-CoA hydratase